MLHNPQPLKLERWRKTLQHPTNPTALGGLMNPIQKQMEQNSLPKCTLTNLELLYKVAAWNKRLGETGGRAWKLQVPPNPNDDPDFIISEMCLRFKQFLDRDAALKIENPKAP